MAPERRGTDAASDRTDSEYSVSGDVLHDAVLVVEGQGTPASFEVSVDGTIEFEAGDPTAEAVVVSDQTAEGAVEFGTRRFRITGTVSDVTIINRGGLGDDVVDPEVYVEPVVGN